MAFQDTAHLLVEPRNEVGEANVRGPVPTIKVGIDSLGMIVAAPRRAKAGPGGGGEGCSGQAGEVGIGNRRCDSGTRRGHDVLDGSGGSRGHHEHEDDCHRRRPPAGSHGPHRSRSGRAARSRLAGRRPGAHGNRGRVHPCQRWARRGRRSQRRLLPAGPQRAVRQPADPQGPQLPRWHQPRRRRVRRRRQRRDRPREREGRRSPPARGARGDLRQARVRRTTAASAT